MAWLADGDGDPLGDMVMRDDYFKGKLQGVSSDGDLISEVSSDIPDHQTGFDGQKGARCHQDFIHPCKLLLCCDE